jgi:hypothetical protein
MNGKRAKRIRREAKYRAATSGPIALPLWHWEQKVTKSGKPVLTRIGNFQARYPIGHERRIYRDIKKGIA